METTSDWKHTQPTTSNLKAAILDIPTAGTDTTSATAEWGISEMLNNPRLMEKVQAELREAFNGKRQIDEADIHKLDYLSKKLYDYTLLFNSYSQELAGRTLRCMKTQVIINAWAIGRDPEHWSDAESFEPESLLGSSIDYKGTKFEYTPIGDDRRMCPGISFSKANIEHLLAQLLYHFDWKLLSTETSQKIRHDRDLQKKK